MKIQALLSAACVLLTAVPSALAEEQSRAVAKPIDATSDVLESVGLFDSEDEEEDYDMMLADKNITSSNSSKDDKKKKKKNTKDKSKRKKRHHRHRRHYKKNMCEPPKMRSKDRKLCKELDRDYCSSKSRRKRKHNRSFCRHIGIRDYAALVMATDSEEDLSEEYQALVEEVANNLLEDEDEDEEEYDEEDIMYLENDSDTDRVDWDNAKNRTKNAGRRVAEGTKKAAEKTAEGSKKAWSKTEEGSKKAWDKTKDWGKRTFGRNSSTTKSTLVAVTGTAVLAMFI